MVDDPGNSYMDILHRISESKVSVATQRGSSSTIHHLGGAPEVYNYSYLMQTLVLSSQLVTPEVSSFVPMPPYMHAGPLHWLLWGSWVECG